MFAVCLIQRNTCFSTNNSHSVVSPLPRLTAVLPPSPSPCQPLLYGAIITRDFRLAGHFSRNYSRSLALPEGGGIGGNNPPPPDAQKYILNKKCVKFLFFISLPQILLGRLTTAIHGSEVSPSQEESPPQKKFWLRLYSREKFGMFWGRMFYRQ